jgi:hypothetical protein
MEMVESDRKAACGHVVKLPCYKTTSGRVFHQVTIAADSYLAREVVEWEIFASANLTFLSLKYF